MPTIKQQNMQVFIITKDNNIHELERFITKNQGILKPYLLMIEELTPRLKECLDRFELDYLQPKNFNFNLYKTNSLKQDFTHRSDSNKAESTSNYKSNVTNLTKTPAEKDTSDSTKSSSKMRVFTELIRSGVDISSDDNIVIFNRVNSGANIKTKKNVFIFGKCDGNVNCGGEYMILSQIANGKILFNGMAITQSMLKYKLNLIVKDGDIGLKVSDIFSLF